MAKPRKKWSELTPAYRNRLKKAGVSPNTFNAGKAHGTLKTARGHARTPERPERAVKKPHLYPDYIEAHPDIFDRVPGGRSGPILDRNVPPSPLRPREIVAECDRIGYPGAASLGIHVIWRHKKGAVPADHVNGDIATALNLRTGDTTTSHVFAYREGDFAQLIQEVHLKGWVADVQSGQYDFKITT